MTAIHDQTPRAVYESRLSERNSEVARLDRLDGLVSKARGLVFASAIAIVWLGLGPRVLALEWLFAPIAGFASLAIFHEIVIRKRKRLARAAVFYERGIARLDDRWPGTGNAGERHLDAEHPYAADLDLFGAGSLFELLATVRTHGGEDMLAGWLLRPAEPAAIRARQAAVEELRPRLDLREELSLLGDDVRAEMDPQRLVRWASEPERTASAALRLMAATIAAGAILALVAWQVTEVGPTPFLVAIVAAAVFARRQAERVAAIVHGVERAGRDLALLAVLLARIERERFEAPRLVALRKELDSEGEPPSRRIARLGRLVDLLDSGRNPFFAPLALVLLWTPQVAFAIESWRAASGRSIGRWLAALGEIEATVALASYAFDHPADPFPEILEDEALFEAEAAGHPLIPEGRVVRNDIRLGGETRLLVVSGSNMSGKSTFLRTVGVNGVLAFSGAPVRARRLRISPLAIGASIRVQDSLRDGRSRFYAEILRLRQLLEIARGGTPLLFLLDEILHGTNSHDRGIGAEAVVRGFAARGAIGLVTTHDLALATVADALAPAAANVHFEDHLEGDRIAFDYRMRAGVVRKSNALALMRAIGLEV